MQPDAPPPGDAALEAVFAYGSNLDLDDLARWLAEKGYPVERPPITAARLPGWRLVWNYDSPTRRGGAANVEPIEAGAPPQDLPGAVLHVSPALLAAIDHKEGHPERYRRRRLTVYGAAGPLRAWVYVVTPPWRAARVIAPRRVYLDTVLRGARALGLPADHIAAIAGTVVLDE